MLLTQLLLFSESLFLSYNTGVMLRIYYIGYVAKMVKAVEVEDLLWGLAYSKDTYTSYLCLSLMGNLTPRQKKSMTLAHTTSQ